MSIVICRFEGGAGCPEVDGGPHYFAWLIPGRDNRICIDCGADEQEGDVTK